MMTSVAYQEPREVARHISGIGLRVPPDYPKARAGALELEKHAYQIKEYFGKTQPAKPTL